MAKLVDFIKDFTLNVAENKSFSTATFSLTFEHKYGTGLFGRTYTAKPNILINTFHHNLFRYIQHQIHANPINDINEGACHYVITIAFLRTDALKNSVNLIKFINSAWEETIDVYGKPTLSSGVFIFNNINKSEGNYNQQISLIVTEHNSLIELFSQNNEPDDSKFDNAGW